MRKSNLYFGELKLTLCLCLVLLPGCTGFRQTLLDRVTPQESSAINLAVAGSGTVCAKEYQFCSFSGTKQVIYRSLRNSSLYKTGTFTDGVSCGNAVFGDPDSGADKQCEIVSASTPTPTSALPTVCAQEYQYCKFSGTKTIYYGNTSVYFTRTASDQIYCNNSVFGDPAPEADKMCWYLSDSTSAPTPTPTPAPKSGSIAGAPTLTPTGSKHTNTMVKVTEAGTVIDGHTFDGAGTGYSCLAIIAANVTVRNSVFRNCKGSAINPETYGGLRIYNNTFINSDIGVYVQDMPGDLQINNNLCHNSMGSNVSACIKLNGVKGPGILISGNVHIQDPLTGNTEDIISIYATAGTAANPAIIENNYVEGTYNVPDFSGNALNAGDFGSSNLVVRGNIYVNPGAGKNSPRGTFVPGWGINGGNNIKIQNNTIWCRDTDPNVDYNACRAFVHDYYRQGCAGIEVSGNIADITTTSGVQLEGFQDIGGCSVTYFNNNWKASIPRPSRPPIGPM